MMEKANYNSIKNKHKDLGPEPIDPHTLKYDPIDSEKKFFFCILSYGKSKERSGQLKKLLSEKIEMLFFTILSAIQNRRKNISSTRKKEQ